ncbi:MAG: glycine zipper family protein [Deltaproteobacteria bacterium]|nr:glycine zipper family protein [Deltaproteobacteria bacterium]
MGEFIGLITSFPTVLYTVGLTVALLYWLFVIVGAVDIDLLDGEGAVHALGHGAGEAAAHGAAHALGDGVIEAAAHGAAHAVGDGVVEGALDAAGHAAPELDHAEAGGAHLADLLHALRLRQAPLTVVLSFLFFFGFAISATAASLLPELGSSLLGSLARVGLLLGAFLGAVPLTSFAVRPFAGLFVVAEATGKATLVGRTCIVSTGRVDAAFGRAEVAADSGAGVLVDVRSDKPNQLKKGDEALLVDYDAERDCFVVEPLDLRPDPLASRSGVTNSSRTLPEGSGQQER